MSETLATQESAVPALVNTPALEIGAEDVALPRIYLGQYMSEAVKDQLVPAGAIFVALGKEDTDPNILWEQGNDTPVRVHVLGLRKGKSVSEGGELVLFDFNDPDAPPDAWVTYNYVVALPEVDAEVPAKWLLTRTGKPAAQQMNMVLKRNETRGPAYLQAFDVWAEKRNNTKGEFFVPKVRHVEADADHLKIAEKLAVILGNSSADIQATGEEPAI